MSMSCSRLVSRCPTSATSATAHHHSLYGNGHGNGYHAYGPPTSAACHPSLMPLNLTHGVSASASATAWANCSATAAAAANLTNSSSCTYSATTTAIVNGDLTMAMVQLAGVGRGGCSATTPLNHSSNQLTAACFPCDSYVSHCVVTN